MFRVNQTEWINPKLKGVEHVEIKEYDEDGKTFFYVDISTKLPKTAIVTVQSTLILSTTPKTTLKI